MVPFAISHFDARLELITSFVLHPVFICPANMGVKGAWPFLKKHGIEGSPIDVKSLDTRIHVDALSIFHAYILATDYSIRKDLY
jgi:hypothetical protein